MGPGKGRGLVGDSDAPAVVCSFVHCWAGRPLRLGHWLLELGILGGRIGFGKVGSCSQMSDCLDVSYLGVSPADEGG